MWEWNHVSWGSSTYSNPFSIPIVLIVWALFYIGNYDVVPHDLLYLSSRVFAFRENRTMYFGVKYMFNPFSLPVEN
jgi:hypothetical protein